MSSPTVLFVYGFGPRLRARDLGQELECYGPLVRVDIPGQQSGTRTMFGFVEFQYAADAEEAYYDMHGRWIDGYQISINWARRPRRYTPHAPSYYDTRRPLPLSPPHSTASHAPGNGRGRSLSPVYGSGRGVSHRYDNRDRRDDRDQHDARGRENDRDHREDYERDRRRSVSPPARRDDAGQGGRFVEYTRSHSDNNRYNRGYDDRRARHRSLSSSRSPQPRQHDSDSRR